MMSRCCPRDCEDRSITCKETCAKWKKYQFFKYLEKRKRQQERDADGFLRECSEKRHYAWTRKKQK